MRMAQKGCEECGQLSPFHAPTCKRLPAREDLIATLREMLAEKSALLESAQADLAEERQEHKATAELFRQAREEIERMKPFVDLRKALHDADLQLSDIRAKLDAFDALARKHNYPGSHGPEELREAFEALGGCRGKCDFKDCGKPMPCPDHWTKEQAEALIQEVGFKRVCEHGDWIPVAGHALRCGKCNAFERINLA